MLGVMSFIIPVGVAISTFGAALSSQFSTARLCYVAATEGHMIEVFSYIHMRRLTPAPAVVLQVSNPLNCYSCISVIVQTLVFHYRCHT
jgi:L-type amino acid transporter 9